MDMYKNCKWCLNRDRVTGECLKVEIEAESNIVELIEDGYFSEWFEENYGWWFDDKDDLEEIIIGLGDYFLKSVKAKASLKGADDEFCCKYYR